MQDSAAGWGRDAVEEVPAAGVEEGPAGVKGVASIQAMIFARMSPETSEMGMGSEWPSGTSSRRSESVPEWAAALTERE